ncbi:ABC transporter permease subunit [Ensifer adhaerens]|uniref:ABC transporter permease n=1 Tax=Ensifer adhaerens TaxID=106592 RepID=UPI001CBFCA18|nr:ABC transporter permease subunit [Ensifer adhaerens]MBZ7924324.1 ABC transporter permease subunit [Ensifer adhaerens]UAX96426.1 ABC transporter permease subunit [Ensifer adhaerens]UAY04231.1 ABC transporter permease subunit [Ensifer adhaerens]UAY12217.1 ABC transporter permease subunit [Ensifer adhaerens]
MADRYLRIAKFPRGAVLPLVVALIWSIASSTGILSGPMAVSPLEVVATPFVDHSGRELWMALIASIARVLSGGILGGVIGLVLGYVAGMYRTAALALAPTVHTIRQVALFAWIPLLTAWFGNGESTKLVFTALSTFFPLFLATEHGVRQAPVPLVEAAYTLRLKPWTRARKLYLPAALPSIYVGLQIAVLSAWIGTVGAEYAIGNGLGLGSYIASARDQFRMDIVLVGVFALAAGGVALSAAVRFATGKVSPWSQEAR